MKVEWIKISVDMFANRKIKRILREQNGIEMVYTWIRLLVIAGELNDGGRVYFCQGEPYTPDTLAAEIGVEPAIVKRALELFKSFHMIEDDLRIANWEKYQNIEVLDKMREKNRVRQQAFRERKTSKEAVLEEPVTLQSRYSNVSVTLRNATEEKRGEEKRKEVNNIVGQARPIVEYLNKVAGTNYRASSKTTQKHINARLAEGYTQKDFFTVIDKKWAEWQDEPKMLQYMRPSTLFGPKFEGYLNSPVKKESVKQANIDAYEAFIEADQERARRGNGI